MNAPAHDLKKLFPTAAEVHLDPRKLYRFPWSYSDNVISWLEPTSKCNLACEGCYRENVDNHKSLKEVRADLDVFNKFRTYDGVSIAGGDPLLHPDVIEIVRMVAADGHKPIINTNGLALTEPLARALKEAGLIGFTFHIDSKQGRPGWKNKTELQLNELRLQLATMVHGIGGLSCAFNATIYEDTLKYVPDLVQFAEDHIDKIDVMVFILFRAAVTEGEFDFVRNGKSINADEVVYSVDKATNRLDLQAPEVVAKIRERFPDFQPSAYLGGTEKPDSFKWLFTGRFGFPGKVMGYTGPRFMEMMQTVHHLFTGKYLAYAPKATLEAGRSAMALAAIEPGVRTTAKAWLKHLLKNPLDVRKKLHFQAVMMIQPIDFLPDGRSNMCDGCPDVTVHDGQLVWSCRLEEYRKYGGLVTCVPKGAAQCGAQARAPAQVPVPAQAATKSASKRPV